GGRRRLRVRCGGRGRDYARAGRRRPDDHRRIAAQLSGRRLRPRRTPRAGWAMTELFVSAFVTFLVVIDPPGCAPIFASITAGANPQHRRAMAVRSVLIASGILIFFGLL